MEISKQFLIWHCSISSYFLVSIILARYFEGVVTEDEAGDLDFPMTTLPGVFIALYVITSTEN